jgi:hypothetical protein
MDINQEARVTARSASGQCRSKDGMERDRCHQRMAGMGTPAVTSAVLYGPLAEGTTFRWKAGGNHVDPATNRPRVRDRVDRQDAEIKAVHVSRLAETVDRRLHSRVPERVPPRLPRGGMQERLQRASTPAWSR